MLECDTASRKKDHLVWRKDNANIDSKKICPFFHLVKTVAIRLFLSFEDDLASNSDG